MRKQLNRRQAETLDYIQGMLGQLRTMADAERCEMLAYLVEMAYIEATAIIHGDEVLGIAGDERDSTTTMSFKPAGKIKLQ